MKAAQPAHGPNRVQPSIARPRDASHGIAPVRASPLRVRGATRVGFTVRVPDEVDLKIELEVESDARELEIELTW